MTHISVLIAGEQAGAVSSELAGWILQQIRSNAGVEAQLLDARDRAAGTDGFVVVTPTSDDDSALLLSEVVDAICPEGNRITIGFARHGSGNALRPPGAFVKFHLAEIRPAVHVPIATLRINVRADAGNPETAGIHVPARQMIDDLLWWIALLRTPPEQRRLS